MQPTQQNERYTILDVLRGFALAGVLVANMSSHSGYFFMSAEQQAGLSTASIDGSVFWMVHFLTDGKFYSIFSILFGIGFALQISRSKEQNVAFINRYSRRLGILFIIGILHAVLFYVGDILTVYALVGFVLLLFRNTSDKMIIRTAFILVLLPIVQYFILWLPSVMSGNISSGGGRPPIFDQIIVTYQNGSIQEIISMNIGGLIMGRWPDLFFTGRFFKILAMFLLGFYITRRMLFTNINDNKPFLKKVMIFCAFIGIPSNIILAQMMGSNAYYEMLPAGIIQPLVYAFGVPAMGLFYAIGVLFLYQRKRFQKLLNIFAPVGQMALTNYLMQSVICCFIFMSYGLGYFTQFGPSVLTIMAIVIFSFQIIFSYWWLRYFKFGPVEWLWRILTYRQWQPIIRQTSTLSTH